MRILSSSYQLDNGYPFVEKNKAETEYVINHDFSSLRHKKLTHLFDEDLRIIIYAKSLGKTFPISYEIHEKNLPNPLTEKLFIKVIE